MMPFCTKKENWDDLESKSSNPEDIPNWDKLPDEASRNFVRTASERSTVTINDDGLFMIDMIAYPATPGAYMYQDGN